MQTFLLTSALIVIGILVVIAIYLNIKLYKRKAHIRKEEQKQQQKQAKKIQQIQMDIRFIAKAYLAEQVELNEASLRIHHLANYLGLDEQQRKPYSVFDTIATQIQAVPTHDEWKSLDKKTRRKYEAMFFELESNYSTRAKESANEIASSEKETYLQ